MRERYHAGGTKNKIEGEMEDENKKRSQNVRKTFRMLDCPYRH